MSESIKHAPEDVLYLDNGLKVSFVAMSGDKYVVREIEMFDQEEGEEDEEFVSDVVMLVDRVHVNPPMPSRAKDLAELDQKIAARKAELLEIDRTIVEAQRGQADIKRRLAETRALKRVDDFLAGRFTHCVLVNGGDVSVATKDSALKIHTNYDHGLKLMTLFGRSQGDLSWRLNTYSDGSGSWSVEVFPCFSAEEARAEAEILIMSKLPGAPGYFLADLLKSASALGIVPPPAAVAAHNENRRQGFLARIEKARAELAAAETALAEVK